MDVHLNQFSIERGKNMLILKLKLTGSILVLFSTSLMGYIYGKSYKERLENLIYLENCIKLLETEIIYGANPLPEAFMNVYNKGNKKVSYIFRLIIEKLNKDRECTIFDSFLSVGDTMKNELNFKNEDIEMFMTLGRSIGSSDRTDQEKNFKLILTQIKTLEDEARIEKDKNEKMFKNLGFLAGLAIVVILI
jgi:stage III sporulation protein AB